MKFSMSGKIAVFFTRIADMAILSLLWIVMCIPVLTVIPSSIALYYTAAKVLKRDCGNVFPEFFRSFRENLRQGCALDVIYLALGAVLIGIHAFSKGLGLGTEWGNAYYIFYLVCIVLLAAVSFYLLPVLSRFQVSLFGGFRLAVYFAFRNLGTLIPMLITLAGACAIIYIFPIAALVLPGFYAYLMTNSVEPALRNYIIRELDPEEHAHMWYMDGWEAPQEKQSG